MGHFWSFFLNETLDTTYGSTSGGGEKQKGKKFW
jgi:hypothetical protein